MHTELTLIGYVSKAVYDSTLAKPIFKITLADTKKWITKDGTENEKTTWWSVPIFNEKLIDKLKGKLKKGAFVMVRGEPDIRLYENKNGDYRLDASINIGYNGMLKVLKHSQELPASGGTEAEDAAASTNTSDEVPF